MGPGPMSRRHRIRGRMSSPCSGAPDRVAGCGLAVCLAVGFGLFMAASLSLRTELSCVDTMVTMCTLCIHYDAMPCGCPSSCHWRCQASSG